MEDKKPNVGVAVGMSQNGTVLLTFVTGGGTPNVAMSPDGARSLATSLMIFADLQEPEYLRHAGRENE